MRRFPRTILTCAVVGLFIVAGWCGPKPLKLHAVAQPPDDVLLAWKGGKAELWRSTSPDMSGALSLGVWDHKRLDPVLGDGVDYYYQVERP